MSLIKWTPLIEPSWGDDWGGMVDWPRGWSQNLTPAVDVYQDKDNVTVEAPLAGVEPDKVDISIENDVLTIKGQSEKKTEVDEKNYYRKEVRYGSFFRSIPLPARVVGDQAEATYEKGILKIVIPKAPEAKPKTIKIKANNKK